jgi:hypothetical protein
MRKAQENQSDSSYTSVEQKWKKKYKKGRKMKIFSIYHHTTMGVHRITMQVD